MFGSINIRVNLHKQYRIYDCYALSSLSFIQSTLQTKTNLTSNQDALGPVLVEASSARRLPCLPLGGYLVLHYEATLSSTRRLPCPPLGGYLVLH
ncbi:hypothetical protein RRG08_039067 [Elysia crispata]|uniref:Uncharacterized protein n=1 Tax=Elysia crispata TaxID=231223 RepID=A0AAE1CZQ9_9GAST|nr:hypothetical protein RRG08_039067 [Elysia crispata]